MTAPADIPVEFDPFSLVVAVVALWIAISEWRRNTRVLVRLLDCTSSYHEGRENGGRGFYSLTFRVRNEGITLYNPSLVIVFQGPKRSGTLSYPLRQSEEVLSTTQPFVRGMIAEFYLKSYEMASSDFAFLDMLRDYQEQEPRLCLYSQRLLCKELRIGGLRDKLTGLWNQFARKVNDAFTTDIGRNPEGQRMVRTRTILPIFPLLLFHVRHFVQQVGKQVR